MYVHLHFGPGALGLGLVAPGAAGADSFALHIVGRPAASDDARVRNDSMLESQAWLTCPWDEMDARTLGAASVRRATSVQFADVRAIGAEMFAGCDAALITFAIRHVDGLANLMPALVDLAATLADRNLPVAVVQCENDPGPSWPDVRSRFETTSVECLESMVDRVCPRLVMVEGRVVVYHEAYSHWAIEAPRAEPLRAMIDQLASAADVRIEQVPDIAAIRERKRLLVNGTDILLGLAAFVDEAEEVCQVQRDVALIVDALHVAGIVTGSLVAADLEVYNQETTRRLAESRNAVSDVISRFNWYQMDQFFMDADYKFGAELRHLLRSESPVAVQMMHDLAVAVGSGRRLIPPKDAALRAVPPAIHVGDVLAAFETFVGGSDHPDVNLARSALERAARYELAE